MSAAVAIGLASGYLGLLLVKAGLAQHRLRRAPATAASERMAQVTVLQPILAGDPGLGAILAEQVVALPEARFLWLIDDDDAEAQRLTAALAAPTGGRVHVQSFAPAPAGCNPKAFKLARAMPVVATEYVLVLDDDARLPAASLATLLAALDHHELATALPHYRVGASWPARWLAQFVNDNAALTYLAPLAFVSPVTINGMAYTMRTERLRCLGGFHAIERQLTDDLAIADLVRAAGGRIAQTAAPVAMQTDLPHWSRYVAQMHRWMLFATLLLRRQSLATNLLITVLGGVHPLLLWGGVGLAAARPGAVTALPLLVLLVVRWWVLRRLLQLQAPTCSSRPLVSILVELVQPLHLLHAACRRTIRWRTRRYRVFDNDRFVPA
ncbi:MAG: glycosyltransferase [Planctomycetes bacterium]|jgi:ceramide glucosyltransferase|nr:glycosyltransferase [Planctomycetota bacterium]